MQTEIYLVSMIKTAFVSEQLYSLYFSRWPYIFVLGGQKNTNYDIMPAYASKYEIVQTVMFLPREREAETNKMKDDWTWMFQYNDDIL